MKKNKLPAKIVPTLLTICVLLTLWTPAFSKVPQNQAAPSPTTISSEIKHSPIITWAIGGLLATGVVAIGFKNAKRSHLD